MTFLDIVLYTALIIFVLYITRVNNIWGVSKGTKKAKEDVRLEKNRQKKRARYMKIMEFFANFDKKVGSPINEYTANNYKHRISRLRIRVKALEREIKPNELAGLFKFLQIFGTMVGVVLFALTWSVIPLVFLLFIFTPAMFNIYAVATISAEDELLEEAFPDLYIILYSRLTQGTNARIAPTLQDFLISLDAVKGQTKSTEVIKRFVLDLRNNIEIYGDDSMAIRKLRDKYTSVMVVNFSNLAVQALNGVDNKDKLLSFKVELNQKRVENMKNRADKLVRKGSRSIIVVYIILFQFILLSWIAKLTQAGGIGGILGF